MRSLKIKYDNLSINVKASFWFLVATFFQRGVSVITTPIFTRLMSTSQYGQYNVFNSWLDIFMVFVSLKLYAGIFSSGYVKFEDDRNRFSSALQGLCFTLTILWIIAYLFFQNAFNTLTTLSTIQMLSMFSMIWTTSVFTFWSVEQRTQNKYVSLVIMTIVVSIAKPTVGIFFVIHSEDKVTARIIGLAVVELFFYFKLFVQEFVNGRVFFHKQYWLYALKFNIPLIPHYLSTSILNSADRIMIKMIIGESEAGIYGLAYSISMVMTLFNQALLQTLEPWIYKKIKTKDVESVAKVVYSVFGLIASVNILLIAFAPEAVRIFAPVEYYDAIWVIPPIAMSVFFMFAYSIFATFEFYYEKKKYVSISTCCGAIVNIILNYIFINNYGYYAAGYTTLVCYMIYALLHYLVMKKVCNEELKVQVFNTKVLLGIIIVFLGVGFMLMCTYLNDYVRYALILTTVIGMIIKHNQIKEIMVTLFRMKNGE